MDKGRGRSQWHQFVRLSDHSKKLKTHARKLEKVSVRHAKRFLVDRWDNVREVRREIVSWLVLATLLILLTGLQLFWSQQSFMKFAPVAGGTYAEGSVGQLDTINPLFASTTSEQSAAHLIFSRLLRYDATNKLVGDVATSWSVSQDGKEYTMRLNKNARWHDGRALTAKDVVFTVNLMRDPRATSTSSPVYRNWAGVKAKVVDDATAVFTIPTAYAPFLHALTFGILPEHLLKDVAPGKLREAEFNRSPVGSGPFVFRSIQTINPDTNRSIVHMDRFKDYYGTVPAVEHFQLHTFDSHDTLRKGFLANEITAAYGLTNDDVAKISQLGTVKASTLDVRLQDGMYAFLNNDREALKDVNVRKALLLSVNRPELLQVLGEKGKLLEGPLIDGQVAADLPKQAGFDLAKAGQLLDEAGWKLENGSAVRTKDGQKLTLSVVTLTSGTNEKIVDELSNYWKAVGADVTKQIADPERIASDYLLPRNYDVLVYQLAIGADPDVYAYWHSTQAARGFNFSNYRSGVADDLLASARSRLEPALRASKYKLFDDQWQADTPAIALYQPSANYTTLATSTSLQSASNLADATARYRSVGDWTVEQGMVYTTR